MSLVPKQNILNAVSVNDSKEILEFGKSCFHLSWKTSSTLLSMRELNSLKNTDDDRYGDKPNFDQPKQCKRYLTISSPIGRLGNQMFRLASAIGIAYKYDFIPVIPKEVYYRLNGTFNLPNIVDTDKEKLFNLKTCRGHKTAYFYNFKEQIFSGSNVSMVGFLQSWKYFAEARDVILKLFRFKPSLVLKAKLFLANVTRNANQIVCIHVRRRDMRATRNSVKGFAVANIGFIRRAKEFFVKKYSKVNFVVVTDDKRWCRKKMRKTAISPFRDRGIDLAIMSQCNHSVITSGTFGWWGAWLAGGTTIYYKGYPRPGSKLDNNTNRNDYYPDSWIGL